MVGRVRDDENRTPAGGRNHRWTVARFRRIRAACDGAPHRGGSGGVGFPFPGASPVRVRRRVRRRPARREEPGDVGVASRRDLLGHDLVQPGHRGHLRRPDVVGRVRDREVAAGGHGVDQAGDDAVGVVLVRDAVQDRDQHHRDRTGEVQRAQPPWRGSSPGRGGRRPGRPCCPPGCWSAGPVRVPVPPGRGRCRRFGFGGDGWATSCVLFAAGMPVPMSRNCRMPASRAR